MDWEGCFQLKDNVTGNAPHQATVLRLSQDSDFLSAEFSVSDTHIQPFGEKYNDPLWKGDVVEVFLSVDETHYFEAELNPDGIGYAYMIHNRDGLGDITLTPLAVPPFSVQVAKTDVGWKGAFRFSKSALKSLGISEPMRANFYRQDYCGEILYLSALSPTGLSNFHIPNSFLSMEVKL